MSWPLEYTPLKVDEEGLAMLGKQSDLAGGEHTYLDHVRRDSFYGFLALRREVALGVGLEESPFAKSTLQLFRARLVIHERMQTVFRKSLDFARWTGYLRSRRLKVVLDTTYVLGRGALKDTYNLLADGIVMLARELAVGASCSQPEQWVRERGLGRYFGSSLKGEAGIDWDEPEAREKFLGGVVADADRVLEVAREAMEKL